ncbi:hypothetical protein [Actinokineospora enzanensis]|uniref:hypothetical protein n=1 Tax=Actinokineospora enzanensis TaxID=155975 RepID=UPI000368ECA2|nr:hypothetical protein [Actinokineospora enzanensis]
MTIHTTPLESILADVHRVAAEVAAGWSDLITADDLAQDMAVVLLERDYVDRTAGLARGARRRALIRIARQLVSSLRDDYEVFTGNWHYCSQEVRELLGDGVLIEQAVTLSAERLDVFDGLLSLNAVSPHYARIIAEVYLCNEPADSTNRRKALQRAVDALTRHMNRVYRERQADYDEGPGSREVLSNDQAQSQTKHDL